MVTVLFVTPILAQCDWNGDYNGDSELNVVDVVGTVYEILDGTWEPSICGCTDPAASNYNPNATIDDCSCESADTVTDIDGNTYTSITVCDQEWMAENLKVTHYQNGDPIPTGFTNSEWINLNNPATGAYAVYPWDNDDESLATCGGDCAEVYGNLYNWYAVDDTRDICPEGWHVPTDAEWTELTDCLGGLLIAGGKMKSTGTIEDGTGLWLSPNLGATNESGFTGLGGGYRDFGDYNGQYAYMSRKGTFWSSTDYINNPWRRDLNHTTSEVDVFSHNKKCGFSVRCVGD